jgi:hypothetical protein
MTCMRVLPPISSLQPHTDSQPPKQLLVASSRETWIPQKRRKSASVIIKLNMDLKAKNQKFYIKYMDRASATEDD